MGCLLQYQVYVETQSGFRKGMDTVDNKIICFADLNHIVLMKKMKLYSAFIDFKKAVDFAVRDI